MTNRDASEARKTTASAMSATSPRRPDGVSSTTAPTASSGEPKSPMLGHVVGQARAHGGGDQPGVDAVDPYAVAELAGLHRGDPGEPVDGGLGGRVDRDAGERDGRRDRGDVDDRAAVAGRAAGPHGAEAVLDAERGAEDVDLEHLADVVGVEVDDQAGDLDAGVVDQDVEPAELGRRCAATAASQLASSVTSRCDEAVALAERPSATLAPSVVLQVGDRRPCAGSGQRLRHALARAPGLRRSRGRVRPVRSRLGHR